MSRKTPQARPVQSSRRQSLTEIDCLPRAVRENLPEHNYISGQFLSGLTSPDGQPLKSMAANADLFEVAKVIRQDEALAYEVIVTPSAQLMDALRANPAATAAVAAIDGYLAVCKCSCRPRLLLPNGSCLDADSCRCFG